MTTPTMTPVSDSTPMNDGIPTASEAGGDGYDGDARYLDDGSFLIVFLQRAYFI